MRCSYISCLVLYIGTALAVLNYGEVPRYVIAPAAEHLQQQQQQQLQSQQQLYLTSQQSLPVNNNFAASPVPPSNPAISTHFPNGYAYMAPAVTTTIKPPTASTQTLNPGFAYSAPMSIGYDQHAYYAAYNQPNYQTATLTAHNDADVEQPTLSFTPIYYVSKSAAPNSEKNSDFYASNEVANKAEVSQAAQSMQPEQQERKEEATTQQMIYVKAHETQTLTPYQRIFREFADYLLWKRAQAKQQQQIQNSQDEQKLSNAPMNVHLTGAKNQFEFTPQSGGTTQTSNRPYEVPEQSATVNLPQTTETPARNERPLQRPMIVTGVGYETSDSHVANLSKPSVSWKLPSYNAVESEDADGQLQAIFSEQVTQRPLSGGVNRAHCEGGSHGSYEDGDITPGYMAGAQKFQTFDRREQERLLEEQYHQQQKQLQQQQQQPQQTLQHKQQEVQQQQMLQQQKQYQQQQSLQQRLLQEQQQQLQQKQQQSLQQQQLLQEEQQQQLQQKQQQLPPLQHESQQLQEVQQQQQSVQQKKQQLSLQKLQQKLQEVQQQQILQQQKQQQSLQQQQRLQQEQQQHPPLHQESQQLQEVQQQPSVQPQLSLQKLQQKLQEVQQQQSLKPQEQQPELSLQKLQQKLQEVQQQQSLKQQEQLQYHVQQQPYQLQQNYPPQQQQRQQQQQQQEQQREYELQQQHHHTQAELQQTLAYLSPAPTQQQTTRLGDEWRAQKPHWPLNSVLNVQQLPQQQPQQGRPLPQSIHSFENAVNLKGKAQTQPIQHAGESLAIVVSK